MARGVTTIAEDILDDIGGPSLIEVVGNEAPPRGHALSISNEDLTKLSALHFSPITAKRCEVERDQARVLRDIREAAAMGSDDFYYSFPVKTRGGGRDYIEGISIDGAMATMHAYRNCEVDCRPIDIGHSWIFLARFIDHERGTSLIRPFMQRKLGGSRIGGDDDGRRLEIAFSIGASKATRNVIANAIRPYTNRCFEEAKNDLVKRVGMDLPKHRDRAVARLNELAVDMKRVEALMGRAVADWTAREVAAVIVQVRTIQQGLATVNDIWPAEAPAEPRRSDAAQAAPSPETADANAGTTNPSTASTAPTGPAAASTGDTPPATPAPAEQQADDLPSPLMNWSVGDAVGQEQIIRRLTELAELATKAEHIDAIEEQNAERIRRITGRRGDDLRRMMAERRRLLAGGTP